MESAPVGFIERLISTTSRELMKDALTHPVTTVVEYTAAAGFTVFYIAGSTVPKYEEIFGLIFFTSVLGFIALFVSITNPRPLMNTLVFTVLCFAGWFGCIWMLHREYGYEIMEIPALWLGVVVSVVACILLFLANTLLRFLIDVLIT
jgi:hypothetical protein